MDTINLVFKLVNNIKHYLEIDDVMVFSKKHQPNIAFFTDVDRYTSQELRLYLSDGARVLARLIWYSTSLPRGSWKIKIKFL